MPSTSRISSPNDGIASTRRLDAPLTVIALSKQVGAAPRTGANEVRPLIKRKNSIRSPVPATESFSTAILSNESEFLNQFVALEPIEPSATRTVPPSAPPSPSPTRSPLHTTPPRRRHSAGARETRRCPPSWPARAGFRLVLIVPFARSLGSVQQSPLGSELPYILVPRDTHPVLHPPRELPH